MFKIFKHNKKGNLTSVFQSLEGILVTLLVLGVVTVITFVFLQEGQDQVLDITGCGNDAYCINTSIAYNSTLSMTEAATSAVDWIDIFVIVGIGVALFGMVGYLYTKRK